MRDNTAVILRILGMLLLACVAASSQPPVPGNPNSGKTKQQKASQKQGQNDAKAIAAAIDKLTSEITSWKEKQVGEQDKGSAFPNWQKWSTIWTAVATVAIAMLGAFQWWVIKKQARYMRDGLAETKKAADAASKGAEAALKNIDLVIAKERARLRIEVYEPEISGTPDSVPFKVFNDGPTAAFIQGAQGGVFLVDAGADPPTIRDYQSLPLNTPLDREQSGLMLILPRDPESTIGGVFPDIARLREGQSILWARGVIIYHDIFEQPRRTSFYLKLEVGDFMGAPIRRWSRVGNPEDNQES